MGNEGLIIVGTGIAIATVAGVTYYLISKNKKQTTSGGGGGTGGGLTVSPVIKATNTVFDVYKGFFGYSYSPSSFVLYGSGFTPNGKVIVSDNYSGPIYQGTADANGEFSVTIQLSSFSPTPGSSEIVGVDVTTELQTAPITLTFNVGKSGGGTLTVSPTINATNTNFVISKGFFGYSYSPPSFVLYGTGFTPNGSVVVSDNYSGTIYQGTADGNGNFNATIYLSNFNPQPGSSEITGIDLSTGLKSAPITLTFTLSSSGSTSGGTSSQTCTSGVAVGNWLTSVGINWYGAGCYQMPDGTYQYFSTESALYNYAVSQGYITTSLSSSSNTNPLGSQSNPYLFDNGYQGPGYYQFTSQEFTKLSSIPASGIKVNPTYMDNSAFYQGIKYWLNYNGG